MPRRVVAVLALTVCAVLTGELVLAWTTYGTADVLIYNSFAATIREVGPIGIYALDEPGLNVYNHPPLVGWWLSAVNWATDLGLPFGFVLRLPSTLAHGATVLLVFAILRRRVALRVAVASALMVAFSPILVIISGFHGNNDSVVAALTIAAVFLLVDRRSPALAGGAFSLAISVKLVPAVALPLLLVAAWRLGRRQVGWFAAGALPIFALLWLPVLLRVPSGFAEHVLAYNGEGFPRVWGLYFLTDWVGASEGVLTFYVSVGSYVVLAVCALLPTLVVYRSPMLAPAALGLALSLFLTLTPSWAPQYLAWIGATVFLVEFWSAAFFTVSVGAVYVYFYSYWNEFKAWTTADVAPPTPAQNPILVFAWACTALTATVGLLRLFRRDRRAPPPAVAQSSLPANAAASSSNEIR